MIGETRSSREASLELVAAGARSRFGLAALVVMVMQDDKPVRRRGQRSEMTLTE
jgi:hypothetical protein